MRDIDKRYYLNVQDLMERDMRPRLLTGDATYLTRTLIVDQKEE